MFLNGSEGDSRAAGGAPGTHPSGVSWVECLCPPVVFSSLVYLFPEVSLANRLSSRSEKSRVSREVDEEVAVCL